jgi:imidazolonepropionase-like amidohydrolase
LRVGVEQLQDVGKLADVVAVRADGLAEVTRPQQVRFAMKDGIEYPPLKQLPAAQKYP